MVQYANAGVFLAVRGNALSAKESRKNMTGIICLNYLDIEVCRKSHERVIKTNNAIKVLADNDSF